MAATARPAPPATLAATTTSGSIRARSTRSSTAKRTSLIVDPPDGRVPALTPAARQRIAARRWPGRRPTPPRATIPGSRPRRAPTTIRSGVRSASAACSGSDRPPGRPRCRLLLQQPAPDRADPSAMMILNEMVHDARIVRMNAQHLPPTIRKWMGDSVGRWDGDTLVVETTNFTDKTRFRGRADGSAAWSNGSRGVDDRNAALSVHGRGSRDLDRTRGPASTPGRPPTSSCTSTPVTRRTTRWRTCSAARGAGRRTRPAAKAR